MRWTSSTSTVTDIHAETTLIRAIRLARPHGEPLPSWEAGAHVKVRLPDGGERSYSLINTSLDPAATTRPHAYRLGVRLEQPSQGGSQFMHALKVGDVLSVSAPRNNFPLEPTAKPVVLLAGGIGVTPVLSMAATLAASKRPYRFIYAGRSRDQLAFLERKRSAEPRAPDHSHRRRRGIFDVKGLMASLTDGEPLYLCGPKPMIDTAIKSAKDLGWADGRLRFEIFAAVTAGRRRPAVRGGAEQFRQDLPDPARQDHSRGPASKPARIPLHDCQRGDCGICQVSVIEGTPDHRDYILTDAEKAAGKVMQICISRSKTPRLVLDL